jgi:hypothetical protein
MDSFTADISSHVQIDTGDETVFRQQEIDTEERLNCITSEEEPHERTLFSRFTITVDSGVLKNEATDYSSCPDFADLYTHIQAEKNHSHSPDPDFGDFGDFVRTSCYRHFLEKYT